MLLESALYLVPTPIGNLSDMTPRAIDVLRSVDVIAAEDTRHSRPLLRHFEIDTPLQAYHDHSSDGVIQRLLSRLNDGGTVGLISDAGTPLISDPGFRLVAAAQDTGIKVVPIPGACAAIAALSASGLAVDRFSFEGFPPSREAARLRWLSELAEEPRTMIFYEAPHRIQGSLHAMAEAFGSDRNATLAREISKTFETIRRATLQELCAWVDLDSDQRRGEIVVVVEGRGRVTVEIDAKVEHALLLLSEELPARQAAALTGRIFGASKNSLYKHLLKLRQAGLHQS